MTTTTLAQFAVSETYQDVELLVWDTAHKFKKRYGQACGTVEEMFSTGNVAFMKAYARHKPTVAKFSTFVRMCVWNDLLETMRVDLNRRKRAPVALDFDLAHKTSRFSLSETLEEMSEDARTVAMLVLDTPNDLGVLMGTSRRSVLQTLRQYLLGAGWTVSRITETFAEIGHVLAS